MNITDQNTKRILKKLRSYELEDRISDYPEEERDGRSDMEMLESELDWYIDNLEDDGCSSHEALEEAKEILRKSRHGKEIPPNIYTGKPMWRENDIQEAKNIVNEYNRLKRLQKKLRTYHF